MLSLKELHAALNLRGVEMSYSALSEFVGTGDIAAQLHVGGSGNRREFTPETVDTLAEFWPIFRELGGKKPHAPALLRRFLQSRSAVPESKELVPVSTSSLVPKSAELRVLEEIAETLKQNYSPPDDELLTLKAAHERYGISYATLRSLPKKRDGRKWKIRRSDVLRWLQQE